MLEKLIALSLVSLLLLGCASSQRIAEPDRSSATAVAVDQPVPDSADIVADDFDAVDWLAPEAFEKANTCMPGISESAFKRMIQDSEWATTAMRPPLGAQANRSYLIVRQGQVICIKTSSRGKALLPVAAFENTAIVPGIPALEAEKMWTDLSLQLARRGAATALVVLNNGKAVQLSYLLAHDLPLQFYYSGALLKQGEYRESDYKSVYRSLDDRGASIVERAKGERVKFIGGL